MTVSLEFGGCRVKVDESTIELAELACVDHGAAKAGGLLRELIPTLTLREAWAAVAEAKRRLDARTIKPEDLTTEDICEELKRHRASLARLEVWIAARDRFTDAGASLAALNVLSEYRRPDDAPEVLAYHEAERDLARAGDELYAAGKSTEH